MGRLQVLQAFPVAGPQVPCNGTLPAWPPLLREWSGNSGWRTRSPLYTQGWGASKDVELVDHEDCEARSQRTPQWAECSEGVAVWPEQQSTLRRRSGAEAPQWQGQWRPADLIADPLRSNSVEGLAHNTCFPQPRPLLICVYIYIDMYMYINTYVKSHLYVYLCVSICMYIDI